MYIYYFEVSSWIVWIKFLNYIIFSVYNIFRSKMFHDGYSLPLSGRNYAHRCSRSHGSFSYIWSRDTSNNHNFSVREISSYIIWLFGSLLPLIRIFLRFIRIPIFYFLRIFSIVFLLAFIIPHRFLSYILYNVRIFYRISSF